jgi:hypothetical protein
MSVIRFSPILFLLVWRIFGSWDISHASINDWTLYTEKKKLLNPAGNKEFFQMNFINWLPRLMQFAPLLRPL